MKASTLLLLAITGCAYVRAGTRIGSTVPAITADDVRQRIFIIADDSMEGRQSGFQGNVRATRYIAGELSRLGLEPAGDSGTFFQVIPLVRRRIDSASTLSVAGRPLRTFVDFAPVRPTATVRSAVSLAVNDVAVIFGGRAGDTITSLPPASTVHRIVLFSAPLSADGRPSTSYSTALATELGRYPNAAAIAVASLDYLSARSASALRESEAGLVRDQKDTLPFAFLVSTQAAQTMMGAPVDAIRPGSLGKVDVAQMRFIDSPTQAPARNVMGILRGSDAKLNREYVAIGAHNDHLGVARTSFDHDSLRAFNSLLRPEGAQSRERAATPVELGRARAILDSLRRIRPARMDSIYNGADDDGSGTVAELEIAEALVAGTRPRRSILFVWHTAEEEGLLGSWWFTDHPTVPRDAIITQLNMDMVGRGRAIDRPGGGPNSIQLIGSRRLSTDLGDIIDSLNAQRSFRYNIDYSFDAPRHPQNRYCRSDHQMYARRGIPITYFSRGYHIDYHLVTDEAQYIDYEGLAGVAAFVGDVARTIANRDQRPRVDHPLPSLSAPCRQ